MVADASRPTTIEKMKNLLAAFEQHLPVRPLRAVVNKCDIIEGDRPDLSGTGLHASEMLQTSAKTGGGVGELFASVATDIARRRA